MNKAKDEIKDVTKAFDNSIHDPGDDNRNFFGQLRETRLSETVENIAGERLKVASTQNEIKSAFEEAYSDLGYKSEIKFSTPEETPELKDKAGTAYVSSTGVHTMIININAKENSTKSGLIGTISEEGSHIINGAKGRQIETGTEEKGLESTGRATNSYFQDKYKDDKTTISMKSDGAIDTSKLGTHVGDRIFLDASLTDAERDKLFVQIQHITDKKLKIVETECTEEGKSKKCTSYEILYDKDKNGKFQKREAFYGNKKYGNQEKEESCNINGNSECVNGNKLINDLIKSKDKIAITNQKDPNNWFKTEMDDGKPMEKTSRSNSNKKYGYEHFVLLNKDSRVRLNTVKFDNNGKAISIGPEITPPYIVLSHELIHVHHELSDLKRTKINDTKTPLSLNGYKVSTSYIKFKGRDYTDAWIDENGKRLDKGEGKGKPLYGDIDEYRTVGIGFKDKPTTETKFGVTGDFQEDGDITENMIRQEHNLNLRANYDSNKIFDNFSIEEEKQREKRIKQLLKEMERGK